MSDRELLLHIGTHKTGTTSFQQLLRANEANLAKRGVMVLSDPVFNQKSPHTRFNVKVIAHHFIRPDLATPARATGREPLRTEAEARVYEDGLVELINGSDSPKVIGSAEAFCFLRTEQEFKDIARFLARIERRPRFYVVFREQADWRRSWLDQVDRYAPVWADIPQHQRVTADWYFDKEAIRNFWRRLGDLAEIDYEKHDDIRVALAGCMGIHTPELLFGPWKNVSRRV